VAADARPALPAVRAAARRGEDLRPPARRSHRTSRATRKGSRPAIRTRIFTFLRAWAIGDHAAAFNALDNSFSEPDRDVPATGDFSHALQGGPWRSRSRAPPGETDVTSSRRGGSSDPPDHAWTTEQLRSALEAYRADHEGVRFDPEARNVRHTHVEPAEDGRSWRVQQVLVDPELHNDWMAEFEVDLAASRAANQPVLWLRGIAPIG
jgi:hypothetical protein